MRNRVCVPFRSWAIIPNQHLDAEECWTQIVNQLKGVPGITPPDASTSGKKFVDQFMMGEMRRE